MQVELISIRKSKDTHEAKLILCSVPQNIVSQLQYQSAKDSLNSFLNSSIDHGIFIQDHELNQGLVSELREFKTHENVHKYYNPEDDNWMDKWNNTILGGIKELVVDLAWVEHIDGYDGWVECLVTFLQDRKHTAGVLALISKENINEILEREPGNRIFIVNEMSEEFKKQVDGELFYLGFEEVSTASGFYWQGRTVMDQWKFTYPCIELFKISSEVISEDCRAEPFSLLYEEEREVDDQNIKTSRSHHYNSSNESDVKKNLLEEFGADNVIGKFNIAAFAFISIVIIYFILK